MKLKNPIETAQRFFLLVFLALLVLTISRIGKSDCTVNWKPGDVLYVEAGRPLTTIIEEDDVIEYKKRAVPENLKPIIITPKETLEEELDRRRHTHYCGEYRDLVDTDLD